MTSIRKCNNILVKNDDNCQILNSKGYPKKYDKTEKYNTKECKEYNKCKHEYSKFMNQSSPEYNPDKWNPPTIKNSHNCYTYFLNDEVPQTINKCKTACSKNNNCNNAVIKECRQFKPQPGYYAKMTGAPYKKEYTCDNMIKNVLNDNPNIRESSFTAKCPANYYKGAMVIDPDKTYHFYRQDNNMRWSHKPGTNKVTNLDASNKPIYNPEYADRDYKKDKSTGLNYTTFCSYFCIPKNSHMDTNAR